MTENPRRNETLNRPPYDPYGLVADLALVGVPFLFLLLFFGLPLWATLQTAFSDADAWTWLRGDYATGRIQVALHQALLSVVATLAVALPLAYLHHRYALPFNRTMLAIHAAPFVLPVFVVVFGIQSFLGRNGWVVEALGVPTSWLPGPLGLVVIAHAYYNYGLAARIITTQLDRRPRRLEAAARTLGASPLTTFTRVTFPLLAPSIMAVALLVFLFSFTSFGVVLFLGDGRVSTMETMLYQNLGGAFPERGRAAVLGVTQLVVNVVVFLAYLRLRRGPTTRRRGGVRAGTATTRHRTIRAGVPGPRTRAFWTPRMRHRRRSQGQPAQLAQQARVRRTRPTSATTAVAIALLVVGAAPMLSVLLGGFRVDGRWSLEALRALLDPQHAAHVGGFDLGRAVLLSLGYALATLVLSLLLTLLLAHGLRRQSPSARRVMETFAAIPLGTSSLLIGLGYLLAFGAGSWLDLRSTTVAVVLAHTLVAFPFTARVLIPAVDLHHRTVDDAARTLGASPWHVFRRVRLPMLRGPLLAAAGFAIAMSLGDFGASILLMRPDTMSLAVWIERHDAPFRDLMRAQATLLSGILMLLAASAYLAMEAFRDPGEEVFG